MNFNLKFGEDDFLFDIEKSCIASVLEWKDIQIEEADLKALEEASDEEIISIVSKYCEIEENIGEECDDEEFFT